MGVPYTKRGLYQKEDYFVDKKNRYVYYDKNLIEEITFGVDFFNGREFELTWIDKNSFKVKVRESKSNWEFESLILLMSHLFENLKEKIFYSGIKYELDNEKGYYLVRTKEKLEIEKKEENTYLFTRTNIVRT